MNYETYRRQAVCDLTEYKYLKSSIASLQGQIKLLKSIVPKVPQPQTSAGADSSVPSDSAAQLAQLQQTLKHNRLRVQCIEQALAALPQSDRDNLNSFYINRYRNSVRDLSRKEYTDRSTLYRRAQRSVDKFVFARFGILPPSKR